MSLTFADRTSRDHPGTAAAGGMGGASRLADKWDLATRVRDPAVDLLTLQPGRPVELVGPTGWGLTSLGFRLLADHSRRVPVVILDVRGWISPLAAWEAGIVRDGLIVVRCPDTSVWSRVTAALLEGVHAVYAEVPGGIREQDIRRLAALARARQVRLALRPLRGQLPMGVAHLRLRAVEVSWEGPVRGHGRLGGRRLVLEASGKGVAGMTRRIEVEDSGADRLRVVPDVVARPARRTAG